MRRADITAFLGLLLGIACITTSIYLGGTLGLFWNIPSLLITVGGSFAALLLAFDAEQIKNVFQVTRNAFFVKTVEPQSIIELFGELARKARREGLLVLEDDIDRLDDPFYRKGVQMMVDALDPELIRSILENDIAYTAQRHDLGQKLFRTWGTLAPAFGMIGTLIGLIQMLARLEDPSMLGPGMAVALVTTFYGAIMANLVFIPVANKLELRSSEELLLKYLMLEGIISIQSGINPRILEERLNSFLAARIVESSEKKPEARVYEELPEISKR
ncbi:MAG: motility protein A [Clostridia bacterium]|nr:motility protein A [Clostridia bacterium]